MSHSNIPSVSPDLGPIFFLRQGPRRKQPRDDVRMTPKSQVIDILTTHRIKISIPL